MALLVAPGGAGHELAVGGGGRPRGRVRHGASVGGRLLGWHVGDPWNSRESTRHRGASTSSAHHGNAFAASPRVNSSVVVRPPYSRAHDIHLIGEALAQHAGSSPGAGKPAGHLAAEPKQDHVAGPLRPGPGEPHRPAATGRPGRRCRGGSAPSPSRRRPRPGAGHRRQQVVGEHPDLHRGAPRRPAAPPPPRRCASGALGRRRARGRERASHRGVHATRAAAPPPSRSRPPPRPRRRPAPAGGAPAAPRRAPRTRASARSSPASTTPGDAEHTICPSSMPTLNPSSGTTIEPVNRLCR